jgi:Ca2+-binding EF-hand superfamily protein
MREKPVFEYDSNRVLNYENCVKEADSKGQSTLRILSDIKQKLEFRFRNSADRRATVKITFSIYDTNQNGLCSEDDFFTSLNQLSIILTRPEFMAICSKFDEYSSGEISYMKFLDIVCPV